MFLYSHFDAIDKLVSFPLGVRPEHDCDSYGVIPAGTILDNGDGLAMWRHLKNVCRKLLPIKVTNVDEQNFSLDLSSAGTTAD